MKYCSKCGHELLDEAIVCVHCGCMIENKVAVSKKKVQTTSVETANKEQVIVNFVFWLLAVIALTFYIIGIMQAHGEVYIDLDNINEWNVVVDRIDHLDVNWDAFKWGIIPSIGAMFTSIASIFLSFKDKMPLKDILASILKAVIGLLLILIATQAHY